MTRSAPHRVQPSTIRVWRLYRLFDAVGRLLYIGQTCRPLARLIEHLEEQGWAAEIARWEVDPRSWWSEEEALAVETAAIRAEKPRYNWLGNEGPHRVWVPKVAKYRHPGRRQKPSTPPPIGEVLWAWCVWWCRRWWWQLQRR